MFLPLVAIFRVANTKNTIMIIMYQKRNKSNIILVTRILCT